MNILVLEPQTRSLRWSGFNAGQSEPLIEGVIADYRNPAAAAHGLREMIRMMTSTWPVFAPELIAVRAAYTGRLFKHPVIVSEPVLAALADLTVQSPLALPALIQLLKIIRGIMPAVPLVLVSETAFFTQLPQREQRYAIPTDLGGDEAGRLGFHGITHAAAASAAAREWEGNAGNAPRILSFCLDPRPELAAIIGCRPVMVTGGASPLDGLPGETSCGSLDPGIILQLVSAQSWSPERISAILQRESGLLGVAGRKLTVAKALEPAGSTTGRGQQLAGDFLRYRFLQAAGSGLAALGGLDVVVYSGQYAQAGHHFHPWLMDQLRRNPGLKNKIIEVAYLHEPLNALVAEAAAATLLDRS